MAKDKIWLISVVVCFLAAAVNLAGTAVGMPDALTRIAGVVNLISLAVVVYRTVYLLRANEHGKNGKNNQW